ncbi:MAG TPA: hypothetical protein VHU84_06695, partial [Lacipirellulaceae bacterium]|nr:hypothetical protein [Lacipirellulaceae bacterium]
MSRFVWRGPAALLALSAIAVTAIAQAPLGGTQSKGQAAQNSNQNSNQAQPNAGRQEKIQGEANRTN